MSLALSIRAASASELQLIEFEIFEKNPDGGIASNFYGISVNKVREVIRTPDSIARTAKDHPAMEGVIDLRGEVIPVIHLPKWLGKYDPQFKYERIVIVEFNMLRAGLLVNRVQRIHHIPYAKYSPPTPFMRGGKQIVTTGVIRNEGKIVMMLDFENMLADIDPETRADMSEFKPVAQNHGKLLVVDDSEVSREMLCNALTQSGYTVLEAQNGLDALDILEEHFQQSQSLVHAVVTDVEMPLMDGLTMISKLKEDKRFREIPVIIFSSMASEERIARWKTMGADDCIGKPLLSVLLERIGDLTPNS